MTTSVFRLPDRSREIPRDSLICHLRSTTPAEAISKLALNGILAIEGAEVNSIILVGYSHAVRTLLSNLRQYDWLISRSTRQALKARFDLAV
jgi:hypothetical protein